jgi:S1-C subfamily serine protease
MRVGAIGLMFVLAGSVCAQDDPNLKQAEALQKTFAKIIEQNDSAIACILVSRSEAYQEFGQGPDKDWPGKLGTFNLKALDDNARFAKLTAEKQKQWRKQLDFSDPTFVPRSFGSGVVIDAQGYILTNYHVVQDATKIFVRLPGGRSSYADVHAADARSDLAVLKLLNNDAFPLKAITLGDADKVQRGHFVLTLSNPHAAGVRDGQPSASWGILSNIQRRAIRHLKEEERVKPLQYYGTLLQTDARLHLGCSGGALLNLQGEMIGLLTSVAAIQGDETPGGFAIPINPGMRRIIEVLKRGEEVDYGFLGVSFDDGAGKVGIRLKLVGKGTPARVEGKLLEEDVLLEVNGTPLHDTDDIFVLISTHLAGTKIHLKARRGDNVRLVDVTLAKLYVPGKKIYSSLGKRPFDRGLRVDYSSLVVQMPPYPFEIPAGVLVSDVKLDSAADRARLKAGDVITHVNNVAVKSPEAYYEAVRGKAGPIELTVFADPPVRIQLK